MSNTADIQKLVDELELAFELICPEEKNKKSLKDPIACTDCKGSGKYIGFLYSESCKLCKGSGKIEKE